MEIFSFVQLSLMNLSTQPDIYTCQVQRRPQNQRKPQLFIPFYINAYALKLRLAVNF